MKNNSLTPIAQMPNTNQFDFPAAPLDNSPTQNYMQQSPMNMYPEVYRDMYPLISDAVNQMIAAGYTPTPESMNYIVDNIIRNSGMWNEDDDDAADYSMSAESVSAIPVQFGYGRSPYRRRMRRHHNRNSLRDIVRILLLGELFNKRGHHRY